MQFFDVETDSYQIIRKNIVVSWSLAWLSKGVQRMKGNKRAKKGKHHL